MPAAALTHISLCLLLLLYAGALRACSSSTARAEPHAGAVPMAAPGGRYSTVWEALKALDVRAAEELGLSGDEAVFARAIESITGGDPGAAVERLAGLVAATADATVRTHAGKVLASLYLAQGRWDDVAAMDVTQDGDVFRAFSRTPPETVVFPSDAVRLPLSFSRAGNPLVSVLVNGRARTFFFDTGAGISVLSAEVAKACGVEAIHTSEVEAGTATSRTIRMLPASVEELRIGEIVFRHHPVMIMRDEDSRLAILGIPVVKIDGIIGWPAIRRMHVVLDFPGKTITLSSVSSQSVAERNMFEMGAPVIRAITEQGVPLFLGLDTGARRTSLGDGYLRKVAGMDTRPASTLRGSVGGWEVSRDVAVKQASLVLGSSILRFSNVRTGFTQPAQFAELDGMLGCDVLAGSVVTIDATQGVFRLVAP